MEHNSNLHDRPFWQLSMVSHCRTRSNMVAHGCTDDRTRSNTVTQMVAHGCTDNHTRSHKKSSAARMAYAPNLTDASLNERKHVKHRTLNNIYCEKCCVTCLFQVLQPEIGTSGKHNTFHKILWESMWVLHVHQEKE